MNHFCNLLYFSNLNLGIELSKDGLTPKHTGAMLYQRCIF